MLDIQHDAFCRPEDLKTHCSQSALLCSSDSPFLVFSRAVGSSKNSPILINISWPRKPLLPFSLYVEKNMNEIRLKCVRGTQWLDWAVDTTDLWITDEFVGERWDRSLMHRHGCRCHSWIRNLAIADDRSCVEHACLEVAVYGGDQNQIPASWMRTAKSFEVHIQSTDEIIDLKLMRP